MLAAGASLPANPPESRNLQPLFGGGVHVNTQLQRDGVTRVSRNPDRCRPGIRRCNLNFRPT
jgi:hypothetical protein